MRKMSGKKILFTLVGLLLLSTFLIYIFVQQISKGPIRLTFVNALALGEKEKTFEHTIVGGLSAIRWNKAQKLFVAVSDDPSARNPARFYDLHIPIPTDRNMEVQFKKVHFLKNFRYYFFDNFKVDMEGLAIYDAYNYFLSSEGNIQKGVDMRLLHFDSSGQILGELSLPKAFLMNKDKSRGPQHNRGLEGLSFSPDKQHLFAAMESSLVQDGSPSNFKKGAWIRILHYQQSNADDLSQWKAQRQYLYPLNPVIKEKTTSEGRNGVSEILAYSSKHLLVLERHHLKTTQGNHRNIGQIFLAYLDTEKDISSMGALKDIPADKLKTLALKKELIFDLDTILRKIKGKGIATNVDNVEGMTWGPPINNRPTLLIISDNNFNEQQKSLFFLFKVKADEKRLGVQPLQTNTESREANNDTNAKADTNADTTNPKAPSK